VYKPVTQLPAGSNPYSPSVSLNTQHFTGCRVHYMIVPFESTLMCISGFRIDTGKGSKTFCKLAKRRQKDINVRFRWTRLVNLDVSDCRIRSLPPHLSALCVLTVPAWWHMSLLLSRLHKHTHYVSRVETSVKTRQTYTLRFPCRVECQEYIRITFPMLRRGGTFTYRSIVCSQGLVP
jgi:hypothetical protein